LWSIRATRGGLLFGSFAYDMIYSYAILFMFIIDVFVDTYCSQFLMLPVLPIRLKSRGNDVWLDGVKLVICSNRLTLRLDCYDVYLSCAISLLIMGRHTRWYSVIERTALYVHLIIQHHVQWHSTTIWVCNAMVCLVWERPNEGY
jgi:hypothetical protein